VHRPLGPAFEVSARRLDARHSAGAPLVALLIEDPVPAPGARASALVAHYGLTPREALLAAMLAEGRDLADAAATMNIAPGTARNYLKAVFRKTGTHRQAALVRLVLRATRFDG
jgi:DNA-binding CsgD family transcriptional regulator